MKTTDVFSLSLKWRSLMLYVRKRRNLKNAGSIIISFSLSVMAISEHTPKDGGRTDKSLGGRRNNRRRNESSSSSPFATVFDHSISAAAQDKMAACQF